MKTFSKFLNRLATFVAVLVAVSAIGFSGTAQARIQYSPNGNGTSATPVFNQFYDVPNGTGDEADFVRVKPKAGGNADYVSTLNDACNVGSSFNIRTYVHNGADPSMNGNGSGTAVAHNVVLRQTAPLNKSQKSFTFESTVSASNAASVTDSATLNCNGNTVKLSLVANSVQTYSKSLGFQGAPDSSVNGTLNLGSRTQGSGDVWACWDDRVIVVYEVKVEAVPPVVGDGVCKVTDVAVLNQDKRNVRASVTGVTTGQGATIVGYEINWGDGSAVSTKQTDTHTYTKDGTYKIVGRVQVKLADGTIKWVVSDACTRTVTFKPGVPPVIPPTTVVPPASGKLPDTGAGSILGIFAGVSAASAGAYQIVVRRRAARV